MVWIAVDGHPAKRITLTRGDKTIGEMTSIRFKKTVQKSKHLMRKFDGWAIDRQALHIADAFGCSVVEVKDTEEGITYRTSVEKFLSTGILIDFGYGEQLVLSRKYWKEVKNG